MDYLDKYYGLKPCERLAAAIVRQAVEDYNELKTTPRDRLYWMERIKLDSQISQLEKWFLSDWCDALTYGNGELLLEMLKRGIEF